MPRSTDKIRTNVDSHGWHCAIVLPRHGDDDIPFAYTIGLVETFNHPEIVIFGLDKDVMHAVLSNCVDLIEAGTPMPMETPMPDILSDPFMPLFRKVNRSSYNDYLGQAVAFYGGDDFDALILFWPDNDGKYVWESENLSRQTEALEICVLPPAISQAPSNNALH